jgi:uncharacterized protein (TIGR01777 family)
VVSGGTGFIGRALCHALVGRGDDVVVLTRGPARDLSHKCRECTGGKIALVTWTPDRPGEWMRSVEGADAVVHLAGENVAAARWTPERKELLRASRVVSTTLLAEAIARAERKPSVFVSASGIGYYGTKTGDAIVDESAPVGEGFLAKLADEWEGATTAARQAGVRVVIPRIGLVLGHGSGVYGRLVPIFKSFFGGPLGSGTQYVPWIHLRDTVRVLETMIDRSDLEGPFNVVAPEPVTNETFAIELGASLDRPAAVRVPKFALKMTLGTEGALETVLAGQRAIPKRLVDAGFAFLFPDLPSALADLAMP